MSLNEKKTNLPIHQSRIHALATHARRAREQVSVVRDDVDYMFTGIITHTGKLKKVENSKFAFETNRSFSQKIDIGSSVAINGVCLTIINKTKDNFFSVEIMPETARRTMFGRLKINSLVNLELPVTATQLLSGHIVQGHIDGLGVVKKIKKEGNSRLLTINTPQKLRKYIVEKGLITVNGISLTVIEPQSDYFTVGIIPFTWRQTMLKDIKVGELVNMEVDILAKYVEKLLPLNPGGRHTKVAR